MRLIIPDMNISRQVSMKNLAVIVKNILPIIPFVILAKLKNKSSNLTFFQLLALENNLIESVIRESQGSRKWCPYSK